MSQRRRFIAAATVLACAMIFGWPGQAEPVAASYPLLSGVGVALKSEDGQLRVGKVLPGTPAAMSGQIKEDAVLISISSNGKLVSLRGKTVGEAASLIRGPVGTALELTVQLSGEDQQRVVPLTREPLELGGNGNISYQSWIGKPAPDLPMTTLDGSDSMSLSDYQGKIVVLDFWASWCATCFAPVTKMQQIIRRHPDWKNKVEFVTVSIDTHLAKAERTIAKQQWKETRNLTADPQAVNHLGIRVIPVVMIIDPAGVIVTMAGSHAIDIEKEVVALLGG